MAWALAIHNPVISKAFLIHSRSESHETQSLPELRSMPLAEMQSSELPRTLMSLVSLPMLRSPLTELLRGGRRDRVRVRRPSDFPSGTGSLTVWGSQLDSF